MKRHIRALLLSTALIATPAGATVTSSQNKVILGGNGSQTMFGFGFVGVAATDIQVIFTNSSGVSTTLVQGPGSTQYQITLNTAAPGQLWGIGGTVTYNPSGTPIPNGSTLTIVRTLPFTQGTSLQNQASFGQYAQSTEQALDQVDMQVQQIAEAQSRVVSAPVVDPSTVNLTLPPATQRANQALIFDGSGNVIAGQVPASGVISSAMQPVVNAATLAAGRTAFGLGTMALENINSGSCGGATIQDDGSGNARVVFATAADAINQSVTCAYHGTQRAATGALVYTLAQSSTLFNGFSVQINALTATVTVTPNASDNFVGFSSGVSVTIPAGSLATVTTNGSGTWYLSVVDPITPRSFPGLNAPVNLQLSATVSASSLTVTVLTTAGNSPSAPSPIIAAFRDPTATAGDPVVRSITSSLSITVPSGATVGTGNAQANRLWIEWADNSGTPVLCVYNSLNLTGPTIVPWNETQTISGTAITSGASSAQTHYCTSSTSNTSMRVLGYVESKQATAGTWATAPSVVQLFGPGVKKPGEVVQEISTPYTSNASVTSTTYAPFSSAQTVTIIPQSAANPVRVEATGSANVGGSAGNSVRLSRGTTANTNMIGNVGGIISATAAQGFYCRALDTPNTSSSQTYSLQGLAATGALTTTNPVEVSAREIQI